MSDDEQEPTRRQAEAEVDTANETDATKKEHEGAAGGAGDDEETANNDATKTTEEAAAGFDFDTGPKPARRGTDTAGGGDDDAAAVAAMERMLALSGGDDAAEEEDDDDLAMVAGDGEGGLAAPAEGGGGLAPPLAGGGAGAVEEDERRLLLAAGAADDDANLDLPWQPQGGGVPMGGGGMAQQQHHRSLLSQFSPRLHYTRLSLLAAFALVHYTLRTRQQAYLALVYLQSSKLAYIVLGNAIVSSAVSMVRFLTNVFLDGLRSNEIEIISENVRWNVTETCLALTMFRSEVDASTGALFLTLVSAKCLHWAAELRGGHLRQTEECFEYRRRGVDPLPRWTAFWCRMLPSSLAKKVEVYHYAVPRFRRRHVRFVLLVELLLIGDVAAVAHCALQLAKHGPSVHILFGFEAAILAVTAMSTWASYGLHWIDGVVGALHHVVGEGHHYHPVGGLAEPDEEGEATTAGADDEGGAEGAEGAAATGEGGDATEAAGTTAPRNDRGAWARKVVDRISAPWRDSRATLSFAIELLAQAAKFLFYLLFFGIVFTYYGMPINIFREVYVSYQNLRRRLTAFNSYRSLTHNMDRRFESVTTDEELDACGGRICIICRDPMDQSSGGGTCKKLPGCGHAFHRHCLREWLVQQQTCPTCRGDIKANEARAKADKARAEAAEAREAEGATEETPAEAEEVAADAKSKEEEGKATREVTTGPASGGDAAAAATKSAHAAFPCLYRVSSPSGAAVLRRIVAEGGYGGTAAAAATDVVLRTVPQGKFVVCLGMEWWSGVDGTTDGGQAKEGERASDSGSGRGNGMMLRLPDGGCVAESDVERLLPVPSAGNATPLGTAVANASSSSVQPAMGLVGA